MLLWKTISAPHFKASLSCFNPCSLGCCSESTDIFTPVSVSLRFQSLFSWMLLWKQIRSWRSPTGTRVSILVLLDVALKGAAITPDLPLFASFNPCSLGCCSESCDRGGTDTTRHWFQSLFSWMLLWKCTVLIQAQDTMKFQSLFSWMLLWKIMRLNRQNSGGLFQSLFSWMLLWKSCVVYTGRSFWTLFQSLFSWMLLWKFFIAFDRFLFRSVSILVLLDVALKAADKCTYIKRILRVSILVLLDVALKVRVFLQIFLRIQRKKPLLYTSCAWSQIILSLINGRN